MHNPWENSVQKNSSPEYNLSLQQNALAVGMLREKYDATTNFKNENSGNRTHQNERLKDNDFELLVKKFQSDPKNCLGFARENLLSISKDTRLKPAEKEDRIRRYIDAYFDLIIKLDRAAFPPSNETKKGIPEYIPDGLVDMGSDPNIENAKRSREKIMVDKEKIFSQSKKLFYDIFSKDLGKLDSSRIKNYFVLSIARFVHQEMPYDYKNLGENLNAHANDKELIPLDTVFEKKLSVCRHHALYAQVLMQSFGLTSRLMKCNVDFDNGRGKRNHAANLVRNNYTWYLLDVTNPDITNLKGDGTDPVEKTRRYETFLKKLPEKNIDPNKNHYDWSFKRNDGRTFRYETRNNMHYYIEDADTI